MADKLLEKIVDVIRYADGDLGALTLRAAARKLNAVYTPDVVDVDGVAVLDRSVRDLNRLTEGVQQVRSLLRDRVRVGGDDARRRGNALVLRKRYDIARLDSDIEAVLADALAEVGVIGQRVLVSAVVGVDRGRFVIL